MGSTNEWLKERARAGAPAWTAVVADEQTAGRGRHRRSWVSQPGDLMMSVLVRPPSRPEVLLLLPLAAGVAVAEAAAALGGSPSLKWPNDVVVADEEAPEGYRKLAGILVEAVSDGDSTAAVIGIGMNLVEPADDELRAQATSLAAQAGRAVGRDQAAEAVLGRMRVWYDAVAGGEATAVVDAFSARSLPWWGRAVEVRSGDTVLRGTARGIDGRGALLLETEGGAVAAVVSGEARQVRLR